MTGNRVFNINLKNKNESLDEISDIKILLLESMKIHIIFHQK